MKELHKIAVISDTHNLLRKEVLQYLEKCEVILHAGDIAKSDIVEQLEQIAPLYIVRGNADKEWAEHIPYTLEFELYGKKFFMAHKKKDVPTDVCADVIICGHSHRYVESREGDALFLNPGSCGPRRLTQPITMAVLTICEESCEDSLEEDGSHHGEYTRVYSNDKKMSNHSRSDMVVEKIEIPHADSGMPMDENEKKKVTTELVEQVCSDVDKGREVSQIAKARGIDMEIVEQIVRMYLTHPGVSPEGIMGKMGL